MIRYRHNEGHKPFGNKMTEPSARKEEEPTMTKTCAGILTLNHKNYTIEMDKKFAAASSNPFSEEYAKLQEVRRDYPKYKVAVITRKEKESHTAGLSFEFMEATLLHGKVASLTV